MYDPKEVEQIDNYVMYPISKNDLMQILSDNNFSVEIRNAVINTAYDTFNSNADVIYALKNYNPSVI